MATASSYKEKLESMVLRAKKELLPGNAAFIALLVFSTSSDLSELKPRELEGALKKYLGSLPSPAGNHLQRFISLLGTMMTAPGKAYYGFPVSESEKCLVGTTEEDALNDAVASSSFIGYMLWLYDKVNRLAKSVRFSSEQGMELVISCVRSLDDVQLDAVDVGEYNSRDALVAKTTSSIVRVIMALFLVQRGSIPLMTGEKPTSFETNIGALREVLHKYLDACLLSGGLDASLDSLVVSVDDLAESYRHRVGFISSYCDAHTAQLFKTAVAKKMDSVELDAEDITHRGESLKIRNSLLPSCGVRMAIPEGYLDINELITNHNQLLVCFRYWIGKLSYMIVYDPILTVVRLTDIFAEKKLENGCFIRSAYNEYLSNALVLYGEALKRCEELNLDDEFDGELELIPGITMCVNKKEYPELRHINGYPRRLPRGYKASETSLAAAEAIGLQLKPGYTYVRSFDRGSEEIGYPGSGAKPLQLF